jgi:eukaryotic-like serine/threonine-protein kinase
VEVVDALRRALADRYRLERELGQGGMATVYLARDIRHDREVALKVLRPELGKALGAERFLREIRTTAHLTHPHILPLLDSGDAGGTLFYVMPYVEGESLRDRLTREKQLPLDDALAIARDVADALGHAHSHGVIHRDIKPENILLEAGHAVVADFGIARAVSAAGGERLTETGLAVGTPAYMSPEQASASAELDGRSDLYSLGCVLYEMLIGETPYTGPTPMAILARMLSEPLPRISVVRETVPPGVEAAIAKALARTPADRYRTMDDFARALASPQPVEVPPAVAPTRRRRAVVAAVSILGVALAVGGGAVVLRDSRVRHARNDLLPEIVRLVEAQDYPAAFRLAAQARRDIPDDAVLARLWGEMSRFVAVTSTPSGADVYLREYAGPDSGWTFLGRTPIDAAQVPIGFFRWRIQKPGYSTVELASSGIALPGASPEAGVPLVRVDEQPEDMVRVSGGPANLDVPGLFDLPPVTLQPYLLDRAEVTNRAFKAFVDSGGYERPEFWRRPFVRDGRPVDWRDAMREFRDATGRPGPAGWEGGSYPSGAGDLPLGGISWYEADAFAAFARKELPTVFHWNHAAGTEFSGYILPLSNFAHHGAARAGTYQGVGPFGTYDMAGNVREWVWNAQGASRYILGGAWDDESYLFNEAEARSPWDRSPGNGVRLMRRLSAEPTPHAALGDLERQVRMASAGTVTNEAYRLYTRIYAYDRSDPEPRVERADSTEQWIVERVSYRAGYGSERMPAFLFLPRAGRPPFQAVVFFPGSDALHQSTLDAVSAASLAFLVTSGRAVLYPVYQGTYGRGIGLRDDNPDTTINYRDHVVAWSKEFRRSVDYLTTRRDIDSARIAYYGLSWGASMGPVMVALEPRVKAAVLEGGGFWNLPTQPEVDQRTFAPRVTVPTLMLNGRYDSFFPFATSQRPLFLHLGTPQDQKRHVPFETDHSTPRRETVREALDWLDRHLGAVAHIPEAR